MLGDFVGDYGGRLFVAAGGVGLALVILVGVLWVIRNRAPSPFVRGGKNRQPRLQVLDAAAVDARRRLVLVRRDGVEHLIMIGGPTDIVIESGIGDPAKAAAPPQPVALEPLPISEPRPAQRLEAPREPQRVIARKPDAEQPLPPPPARAAIEPPAAAPPERRVPPPVASVPPVVIPPPAAVAVKPMPTPATERPQPLVVAAPPPPSPPPEALSDPAPVVERKEVAEAVDILEAARQRVLPPQPQPQAEQPPKPVEPERPPATPPQTPILIQDAYREASIESAVINPSEVPSITPPKPLGSDFESILEEEMTNNLKAERVVPPQQSAAPPRPEPATANIGDSALQSEVARIFGEISVKREK